LASTIEPGASMASIKVIGDTSGSITFGVVVNFCPFPIYARLAVAERSSAPPHQPCDHFGETEDVQIPPFGGRYAAPYVANWDQCGHTSTYFPLLVASLLPLLMCCIERLLANYIYSQDIPQPR
jgi:hypothetical protein